MLVALPRADAIHDPQTIGEGVEATLVRIASATELGPRLRLLPEKITVSQIEAIHGPQKRIVLGLEERRLKPWTFDLDNESHMYVFWRCEVRKEFLLAQPGQSGLGQAGKPARHAGRCRCSPLPSGRVERTRHADVHLEP